MGVNSVVPINSQVLRAVQNLSSVASAYLTRAPQHGLGKLFQWLQGGRVKEPHGHWAVRLRSHLRRELRVSAPALLIFPSLGTVICKMVLATLIEVRDVQT